MDTEFIIDKWYEIKNITRSIEVISEYITFHLIELIFNYLFKHNVSYRTNDFLVCAKKQNIVIKHIIFYIQREALLLVVGEPDW